MNRPISTPSFEPIGRHDPYILTALAVGALLRLFHLGAAPLWLDEVTSVEWIRLGWIETAFAAVFDNHPPLYFLLLKGWAKLVGESPVLLRLPSAALSWLCIPLASAIAATVAGRRAARWAAWLVAISPQLIHHGQEARMYPLLAALATAHVLLLVRFLRGASPRQRLGPLFVVVAAALAATHHYAVFFLGGELALLALLRPRPFRTWLPAAFGASAAASVGLLAALVLAQQQGGERYEFGLLAVPGALWSMLTGYALLPTSEELHAAGWRAALPYFPLALAAAPAALFLGWRGLRALQGRLRLVLLLLLTASIGGPFVVAALLGVGVNPRYLISATPLLLVLFSIALAEGIGKSARRVSAAAVILVMALGTLLHLAEPGHGREDIAAAKRWLEANVGADETVLVTSEEMAMLARFHLPERHWRLYPPRRTVVHGADAERVADDLPFTADRVIYVIGREWLSDPDAALRTVLLDRYEQCRGASVRGIEILCFTRSDAVNEQTARGQVRVEPRASRGPS